MTDGLIDVDSDTGRAIGFTSDRWASGPLGSYLWRDGDEIKCSMLIANRPRSGAFRELVAAIEAAGLRVAVPCPLGDMPTILRHYGFERGWEWTELPGGETEEVEVWRRPR